MARHPERTYTHRYRNLIVSVKHEGDDYLATVRRPSDGYEVTIETFGSRSPVDAARYALRILSGEHPSSNSSENLLPITRARRVLGPDAEEALSEIGDDFDPSRLREDEEPEMSGSGKYDPPFPDEPYHQKEGDVWFNVMQYSDDPKAWVAYPLSGKRFKTEQEAKNALWHMLNEGFIKPGEKHLWGIERSRQGRGPTEVYHVRVG